MTYKEPTLINGQPLSFYLTHPGALKQVDKGVLQTLVVKYPYSAHLHLLLAIKDHLDNGIVSQDLLEKAALYIPDRKKLGEWMNKLQNLRRSDAYGAEHLEALAEQSVPEDIALQEDRQLIDPEIVATDHYEDDEFPTPEVLEKIEEPVQKTETTWEDTDSEEEEIVEQQLAPDEELADISDEFSTEDAKADLQAQVGEEIANPEDITEETIVEVDAVTEDAEATTELNIHESDFESGEESEDRSVDTYEDTIAEELPESEWAEEEKIEEELVRSEVENLWEEEEEEEEEVGEEEVDSDEDQESAEDETYEEEIGEEGWQEEEAQDVESPEPVEDTASPDEEVEERESSEVSVFDRVTDEESRPETESPSTSQVYLDQEAEDLPVTQTPAASLESSDTADGPDTELKLDTETIEDFTDHDSPFLNWLHRLSGTDAGGFEELSEVTEEQESESLPSPVDAEKESKKEKKKKKDKKKKKKKDKKKKKKKKKKRWEEESLRTDEALVSEALAEILANQGHYDRAIEMYKRLRLIIPEKSVFFAQKIEELESKK